MPNRWPTLGVEVELQLVDAADMELRSAATEVLAALPVGLEDAVKPEFLQCYVEINSDPCRDVAVVERDLARKILSVEAAAGRRGLRLFWGATHPFSPWRNQRVTPESRYGALAERLQETVRRPVTFGLHVHVGVDSGDTAVRVGNHLMEHLPVLLALSANSPFWQGRPTGLHAHRIELLEGLPTGGLPPVLPTWDHYVALIDRMMASGFIESTREIWWDIRPCPDQGTVEVRICDMPHDLPSVLGLTALIQCLVHDLAVRVASAPEPAHSHPLMVRQNRWRAARYGLGATLVDTETLEARPARQVVHELARHLKDVADDLGCARHLEHVLAMAESPTGAERQLAIHARTDDLAEVVRRLTLESTLLGRVPPDVLDPSDGPRTETIMDLFDLI